MTVSLGDHLALKGSLADYMNWLKNARFTKRLRPRGPPTRSTARRATRPLLRLLPCLFRLLKGLEQHVWRTLSRFGLLLLLLLQLFDRQTVPAHAHRALVPKCGVPRGPSPLPVAMLWIESIGPERFPDSSKVLRHDPTIC
eukprot:XP_001708659.1 Hypothetical protein GL50803_88658 [Giardia lamblia ATCC 50803]